MINDVIGHWPAEENEKLASRCCTNVRKQRLSQYDVAIICPIDFDSWFEDVNATGTETGHWYGNHHGLAKIKIWPGFLADESHWCLSF